MSTPPVPREGTTAETGAAAFLRRRTGLVVPLLLLVTGVAMAIGTVTMEVPRNVTSPGPQLFPAIVSVLCLVFAVLLAVDMLRKPEPEQVSARPVELSGGPVEAAVEAAGEDADGPAEEVEPETRVRSNRLAVVGLVGTIALFIALLNPLGWLLSGALLFWGVAYTLGSKRPVFDVFLSLAMSSIVQLAFSAGLGLNLPPGILAGVF